MALRMDKNSIVLTPRSAEQVEEYGPAPPTDYAAAIHLVGPRVNLLALPWLSPVEASAGPAITEGWPRSFRGPGPPPDGVQVKGESTMSTMKVSFPGGKRVNAEYHGFTIPTDQPPKAGGEGLAPQPFDLFLASIATCAGIYVKGYCDARRIETDGVELRMDVERNEKGGRVARLAIEILLPGGFPDKHRDAVVRAAELCSVKKHIFDPPVFEVRARSTPQAEDPAVGDDDGAPSTGPGAIGSEAASPH